MDETMNETLRTKPFAAFEWMLSGRYLRARRKEGFISVIAGFSFLGIMLGVATLIIVMAVMNGFRTELLSKILGLNGTFWFSRWSRHSPTGRTLRTVSVKCRGYGLPRLSSTVRRSRLRRIMPPVFSSGASGLMTSIISPPSPRISNRVRSTGSTTDKAWPSAGVLPISSRCTQATA